jgi:hypothetical protein
MGFDPMSAPRTWKPFPLPLGTSSEATLVFAANEALMPPGEAILRLVLDLVTAAILRSMDGSVATEHPRLTEPLTHARLP